MAHPAKADQQGPGVAILIAKRAAAKAGDSESNKRREEVGGELLEAIQAGDKGRVYDIVTSITRMGR